MTGLPIGPCPACKYKLDHRATCPVGCGIMADPRPSTDKMKSNELIQELGKTKDPLVYELIDRYLALRRKVRSERRLQKAVDRHRRSTGEP